jgi:hypothetical protein
MGFLLTTRKHTMIVDPYGSFLAALMKIVSERDALEQEFEITITADTEIDELERAHGKQFHVDKSTYEVRRDVEVTCVGGLLGYIRSYIDVNQNVVEVRAYY